MAGADLVQRTQQTVQLLEHPQFLEQVEALLPDNVPLRRFLQVAKTAIRTTPDLVDADQNSLFAAIIRCAQDGLFPDNHEAALVPYKGKVNYLPMVAGVIRAARDFGWLMHAEAVYAEDEFEWRGADEKPLHRHPRPGAPRGDLVAAYAYATQRGETTATVLYADDIEKRKAKAQTQAVWKEWPEAMWRKSAAHALYRKLPRSERDRVERFDDTQADPAAAAELLYGPDGARFTATPAAPSPADATAAHAPPADKPQGATHSSDGGGQQTDRGGSGTGGRTDAPSEPAAAVPGDDDEPEPGPADPAADAAGALIPNGNYENMTLGQIGALGAEGEQWLDYALRHRSKYDDEFLRALDTFVEHRLPELWARHTERQAA